MTLYIVAAFLVAAAIAFLLLKKKKGLGFGKKSAKTAEIKESPSSFTETVAQSSAVDDQLRREIENNIRHRNYQVAEAQINAALHQDDTQHDLYYLLADVYLHQEDEFAFKQLINHLQQSQLYNLVDELNIRQEAFAQQKTQQAVSTPTSSSIEQAAVAGSVVAAGTAMDFDNLLSTPSSTTNTDNSMDFSFSSTQTETANNSLDFDSLINTSVPTHTNTQEQSLDFDNLLGSNVTTETTSTDFSFSTPVSEAVTTESNELDFSFSQSETQAPTVESNELDFSFSAPTSEVTNTETDELDFSFSQPTTETADLDLSFSTPSVETPVAEINELDLSFSAPVTETAKTEESFDFSFDEPATLTTANEAPDLDLSFSTPVTETVKTEESFDFSFDEPTVEKTAGLSTPVVENVESESHDFDFSFNEPVSESSTLTENLDVDSSLIEPAVSFVEENDLGVDEALVAGGAIVATALATEQIKSASNDPLVNQFPVLNDYDEITVNLKLASQYVKLGAYEAAHQLLAQRDNFNEQQNQQADAILARITA
ncbi:hypothetical protein [Moraxella sp. ZY210820]|uniref:hypothetical protein n=1 Tax=unclassified Moraxella TaxID=2685852 RepID=UPI00273192CE|nr:hypothetical protein [Moraxella sp. ZY210820]WLF83380.1 hypothetical protein LU301_08925 [Moraxella sp. ZY210820]